MKDTAATVETHAPDGFFGELAELAGELAELGGELAEVADLAGELSGQQLKLRRQLAGEFLRVEVSQESLDILRKTGCAR